MYHTGQRGFIVHRLDNAATALDDIVRGKVTAVCRGEKTFAEKVGHCEGTLFFNYQHPNQVVQWEYGERG